MKIIVIGAVAAGTSAAAKARRNSEEHQIVIYEAGGEISYSGCGIPYFLGEDYITLEDLAPRNPAWFKSRFNIDIFTYHQVTDISVGSKTLTVKNLVTGEIFNDSYDKLIIATGAKPVIPGIPGLDNGSVFPVRNVIDAERIRRFIAEQQPEKAVIIGGGFIGLEMAENLHKKGITVTIIESAGHVMHMFDDDMSCYIEDYLHEVGIILYSNDSVAEIRDNGQIVITNSGRIIKTNMIVIAAGVRPDAELAVRAGITTGVAGGIITDDRMETNIADIYAAGDCCEVKSIITGEFIYRPLGSTANKMGRICGDVITGGGLRFNGVAGTGIFKIFGLAAAHSGINEREAKERGIEYIVSHNIKENQSKYLKESRELVIKCIVELVSEKILGVQIVGERGVDKRIDVFVSAMTFGAKIGSLAHLDLAYAPPYSTAKDPVIYSGMIIDNAINRGRGLITPDELDKNRKLYTVIDVRSRVDYEKGHIDSAISIPLEELRSSLVGLDRNKFYVVHCNKGTTGNAAQNLLINNGFKNVLNLSGGYSQYKIRKKEYI